MNPTQVLTREMEEAIPDCLERHRMCLRTLSHLLTLEPDAELAEPEQLNCLLDCAEMCRACADLFFAADFGVLRPCCGAVLPNFPAVPAALRAAFRGRPYRNRVCLNVRALREFKRVLATSTVP